MLSGDRTPTSSPELSRRGWIAYPAVAGAMSTSLTPAQRSLVERAILASFAALGRSPLKLADFEWYVHQQCRTALPGGGYDLYRWCDAAVQRLKREGHIELVRGAGGGWKRVAPSKLGKSKAMQAKAKVSPKKAAPKKAAPKKTAPKKAAPRRAKPPASQASFAPFVIDQLDDTVRLSFFDWDWLEKTHGSIELDDYYLNGPGVEGLVRAVMWKNKINGDDVEGDSEGDACLLYFDDLETATRVGVLAAAMIVDRAKLAKAIEIAREEGFED